MHNAKERLAKMERRHLIAACIVVVVLAATIVAVTVALVARTQKQVPTTQNFSVSGEMICLPHKNTEGPQTLECAYGMRGDDDRNYALELGTQSNTIQIGQRVHVKGTLTTSGDSNYDIVGTIRSAVISKP